MALMDLGSLMVVNSDHHCKACLQSKGEDAAEIEGGRRWTVMIETGDCYHVQCATDLGWQPSEKEQFYLAKYPGGPYE